METSSSAGKGIDSLSQPIDQLELVMADVESFLTDWLRRMEQFNASSATPDALMRTRIREFELEKSKWEAKRKRETQDIHDKAEELTKAWLRLELEQRKFLQVRDAQLQGSRTPVADNLPQQEQSREGVPSEERENSPLRAPTPSVTEEGHARRPSPLQGQRNGGSAVRQFEQLRREIQSNRQQRRV